jgi:hypothetical protein
MAVSGILVTNNGTNAVTINGQSIAGLGGTHTFAASTAAATCADIALRTGFLDGSITVAISGNVLNPSNMGSEDLLDEVVSGAITVT